MVASSSKIQIVPDNGSEEPQGTIVGRAGILIEQVTETSRIDVSLRTQYGVTGFRDNLPAGLCHLPGFRYEFPILLVDTTQEEPAEDASSPEHNCPSYCQGYANGFESGWSAALVHLQRQADNEDEQYRLEEMGAGQADEAERGGRVRDLLL